MKTDFDYAQSDEMEIEEEISMAAEDAEEYQTIEEWRNRKRTDL